MDGLGGGLRQLAREVTPVERAVPDDLWRRGRQRVRRRRTAAGALVAALTVTIAFVGSLVPQPTMTMPAGESHAPAIPKSIYTPSRWLAGTDDTGPLGQLAVLGRAEGRDGDSAFGISAATGEYRFLDLPGRVRDTSVALSPDGRQVAYWITGLTRHQDFPPADGANTGGPVERPIAGVAVYNAEDGTVTRHLVESEYGLNTDASESDLVWLDDDSMLVSFSYFVSSNTSNRFAAHLWHVDDGDFRRVGSRDRWQSLSLLADGTLAGQVSAPSTGDHVEFEPLTDRLRASGEGVRLPAGNYVDYSRFGDRVVVTGHQGSGGIQRVRTGTVGPDSRVAEVTPVGTIVIAELLGWRSDHSVLVAAVRGERYDDVGDLTEEGMGEDAGLGIAYEGDSTEPAWSLYEVDLVSQEVRRLGTADGLGQRLEVTTSLLAAPMVEGIRPPSPLDPRLRNAAIAAGVALLGWAVAVRVRSRRSRG